MSSRNDDMPPPSKEEQRRAEELREALADGRDALGSQLLAATRPGDLAEDVHERILARALAGAATTQAVMATPGEQSAAAQLRDALAGEAPPDIADEELVLASLAHALQSAHAPRPIAEIRNEALLRPALRQSSRRNNRFASIVGALALAAGFFGLWFVDRPQPQPGAAADPPSEAAASELLPGMAPSRTTTDLFQTEDFPQTGGQSSRIDAISQSRRSDLRKNRFVSWGVP